MTIEAAQALIAQLEENITALLQAFQTQTGLTIHSVPVTENSAAKLVIAKVKVQL
jgi:hypothetical protein